MVVSPHVTIPLATGIGDHTAMATGGYTRFRFVPRCSSTLDDHGISR